MPVSPLDEAQQLHELLVEKDDVTVDLATVDVMLKDTDEIQRRTSLRSLTAWIHKPQSSKVSQLR